MEGLGIVYISGKICVIFWVLISSTAMNDKEERSYGREWGKVEWVKKGRKQVKKRERGRKRKGEREQIYFVLPHSKRAKWKIVGLPS